jgi:CBS-domain-containing membrane protein
MLGRIITHWGTPHRPGVLGCLWMAVMLGALAWLDFRGGGIFLVPPFAATMTILLYVPDVSIAQPFAIVFGSALGAAIGTVLSLFLSFGPGIAMMAALTASIALVGCKKPLNAPVCPQPPDRNSVHRRLLPPGASCSIVFALQTPF